MATTNGPASTSKSFDVKSSKASNGKEEKSSWFDPKTIGAATASALLMYLIYAGFFAALYSIATSLRGEEYRTLRRQEFGHFDRTTRPVNYFVPSTLPNGQEAVNLPGGCQVEGNTRVCPPGNTRQLTALYPWIVDYARSDSSAVPGCRAPTAQQSFGMVFAEGNAEQGRNTFCSNGVPVRA